MIEPGINMQHIYPDDPDNYTISNCRLDLNSILEDMSTMEDLTDREDPTKKFSTDAARLMMDNTLIIRQLLDIMTRTMQSQLR